MFQINCWKLEQKVLSITAVYTPSEHLQGVLQRKDLCKACMDSGHWLFQLYQVYVVLCFCALRVTCIFYFIHIVKPSVYVKCVTRTLDRMNFSHNCRSSSESFVMLVEIDDGYSGSRMFIIVDRFSLE